MLLKQPERRHVGGCTMSFLGWGRISMYFIQPQWNNVATAKSQKQGSVSPVQIWGL